MAKIAMTGQTKNGARRSNPGSQVLSETAEIERLAYQFFLERGAEHGHDQEDWARAEAIVKNRKRN